MTVFNNAPVRMALPAAGIVPSYTKVYMGHQVPTDPDAVGKAFWVTAAGNTTTYNILDLTRTYSIVDNLNTATQYNVVGAFYDRMVDSELLDAQAGIQLSNLVQVTTLTPPSITATAVSSTQLDVGVGTPVVTFTLAGAAETLIIERRSDSSWETIYTGGFQNSISVASPPGTYQFRVRGQVRLPDGLTVDSSEYAVTGFIDVRYSTTPPSAATNVGAYLVEHRGGVQTYDLIASWGWSKGSGPEVREFVLEYALDSAFADDGPGWDSANTINTSTSRQVVLPSFPLGDTYRFRVRTLAWGPEDTAVSLSAESIIAVTSDIVTVEPPEPTTAMDIGDFGIAAYNVDGNTRTQTFRIDAEQGNVSIGTLDAQGRAPVTVDGSTGNVNISGRTVTDEIVSASFVLADLTGTDNPAIRTSTKTTYAQAAQGMWIGYDSSDSLFKFDLGDASQFIRWDGNNLIISGNVRVNTPNGTVPILDGVQGNFVANIYIESATQPTTPTSKAYPPTGWSTSPITNAVNAVWIATAVVSSQNNQVTSDSDWSEPIRFTGQPGEDGQGTVTVFRASATQPGAPTPLAIPPTGWSLTPPTPSAGQRVWATVGQRQGNAASITGTWSTPIQFSGNDGTPGTDGSNGTRGAGIYAQPISNFASFNTTQANAFFTSNFNSTPVLNDVITQYNSATPTIAETRRWDGSAWIVAALTIHGDAVIDGTVSARKIVSSSAFLNEAGINVIYDNTAFSSPDPEANFTMKIDLQEGSITIR